MKPPVLLHIEDDDASAFLFRAALEEANVPAVVYRVASGEQAASFLRGSGAYQDAPRPEILVVDLNLPGMDGWQIIRMVQASELLRSIPIAILTTSNAERDMQRALAAGVQEYIAKPNSFRDLVNELKSAYSRLLPVSTSGSLVRY